MTCQLVADNLSARATVVDKANKAAQQLTSELQQSPTRQHQDTHAALKEVCGELLRIAQRYTPHNPPTYNDVVSLTRCAQLLSSIGVPVNLAAKFMAVSQDLAPTPTKIFQHSREYKLLEAKAVAGFATLADLQTKPAVNGSKDFQKGVREGYKRASSLATLFLDDIQKGDL